MSRAGPLVALLLVAGACQPPDPPLQRGTVVGATAVDLDTRMVTVRVGEAAIGNYVSDVLRAAVTAMGYDVALALTNAGAIRGGRVAAGDVPVTADAKLGRIYPAGPLTDFEIEGWLPYRDDHVVMTVTGAQLKSALERGAAQLPPDLLADAGGMLLQLSGGAYTIDCAGAVQLLDGDGDVLREGSRISRLEAGGVLLYDRDSGVDALATSTVRLVVNSFVASGLDGHIAFENPIDPVTIPFELFHISDAVASAVAAASPIAPRLEGRITVVGDCGQPLTVP